MKVLVVQNAWCEGLGTLGGLLTSDGYKLDIISALKDHIPTSSQDYSGIIILGGPMAAYDELSYLVTEQELIRSATNNGVPLLGICLGSQLIAQACGGRVYKGIKKEIGWGNVYLTPEGSADIFRGINPEEPAKVFQWHGDTYELPRNASVLATSKLYPQAFRIGSAIGIQFHLEVDKEMIKLWSEEYRNELDSERIDPVAVAPNPSDLTRLASYCRFVHRNFSQTMKSRN